MVLLQEREKPAKCLLIVNWKVISSLGANVSVRAANIPVDGNISRLKTHEIVLHLALILFSASNRLILILKFVMDCYLVDYTVIVPK